MARPGADDQAHAQRGPACGDEKFGEQHLEQTGRGENQQHPEVGPTIGRKKIIGAQDTDDPLQKKKSQARKRQTNQDADQHQQGKVTSRAAVVVAAHFAGDKRAASGAEHGSQAPEQAHGRGDDVDRRKRVGIDEARHENHVHNGIEPVENHHEHGRKGEAQQGGEGEGSGKRVVRFAGLCVMHGGTLNGVMPRRLQAGCLACV